MPATRSGSEPYQPSNLGQITLDLGQYVRLCLHVPSPPAPSPTRPKLSSQSFAGD